ncbi:DNA polymerase III subunit beta [Hymenobacter rigui]|nr:DNA polymerase III subunit beta [Hymenobacter rigui]
MPSFAINSSVLLAAVKQANAVLIDNPIVPIYSNILLVVQPGELQLGAASGEAELSLRITDVEAVDSFRICLPGKLLLTILSNLPNQPLTLHVDLIDHTSMLTAATGRYKLAGENAQHWPQAQTSVRTVETVLGKQLEEALQSVLPFVFTDKATQPALASVLLQLRTDGSIRAVACNQHAMTWHGFKPELGGNQLASFLLPAQVAKRLGALAGKTERIKLELGDWLVASSVLTQGPQPEWLLKARLVDDRYPEYENLIPLDRPNLAVISRHDLQQALRRVGAFADDKKMAVELRLSSHTVQLYSESIDRGTDASEEVAVDYQGEDMRIAFNAKLLGECLSVIPGEQMRIVFSTPNRAAVFESADVEPSNQLTTRALCMPILFAA